MNHETGSLGSRSSQVRWTVLAVAGIAIVVVAELATGDGLFPVGGLLVPVMALALVANERLTAVAAAVASVSGAGLAVATGQATDRPTLVRVLFVWIGGAVAVGLAHVRARHERQIAQQSRDLTAAALVTSEGRRLAMALDAADLGVWEWHSADDRLVVRRVAAMFGVPTDRDVTAALWARAVHPDDRQEWQSSSRRSMAEREPWLLLHRIVRADGQTRWIQAHGEPLLDERGSAEGMIGVLADVTDRREAELDAAHAAAVTVRMVDALQVLARASSESEVQQTACELAAELFGSDTASFWDAGTDPATLRTRVPAGRLPAGAEAAIDRLFAPPASAGGSAHSTFLRREEAVGLAPRAADDDAPAAGLVTPVRISGEVVAYLALGWLEPRRAPSSAFLAVVDRFAVNVAVALSVVRRQAAQAEAQRLARRLQNGLLPTRVTVPPPLHAATVYRPGERRLMLGGDFLDLVPHPDGRLSFVVGDVAGHGPEQAALGTILRSAWSGLASSGDLDPARWATVLHDMLVRRREDEGTFVTAAMGVLDPRERSLTYVLAGHPPPFQLTPTVSDLPMPEAPPLGMLTRPVSPTVAELPDGFGLLIFTDGLYDGFDPTGARLGFHGLHALVASRGELRTRTQLSALVTEVERMNGGPLADDVAALLIVHDGAPSSADPLARGNPEGIPIA